MKKFLFFVALTPTQLLTPLRKNLFLQFLNALENQTYQNWQAILIGEEEKNDGRIIYKKTYLKTKSEKLISAYKYFLTLREKPDYIIRLDDDDLISPNVLQKVVTCSVDFDCYADKYHAYYDVVSGQVCHVQNAWMPNTIIHKTNHAISSYTHDAKPLVLLDHSKYWMEYYLGKRIIWENKTTPVYLRIMSPTSITSGMSSQSIMNFSTDILNNYHRKTKGIGKWKNEQPEEFANYINVLKNDWKKISGLSHVQFKHSFIETLLKKFVL
ncbi:MAG: glycosyltransferase family 2 protein [Bacteroidetes bacterium]|nr:glycosyltransferase family 2 protein [Bacteroidota bacterium]